MSSLVLRDATRDDVPRLAANSLRAYPDPSLGLAEREQRLLEGAFPLETYFVAERDGEHVGQGRTLPFRGWIGGAEHAVGGLASVAVAPEARRTGVAGEIVRHHLSQLRRAGTPWSFLYPFSAKFYAAYGWAAVGRRLRWRFAPSAVPLFDERRRVRRLRVEEPGDRAAMRAAYARHCVATNGSLSVSERLFDVQWKLRQDKRHVVGVGDGELGGYMVYGVEGVRPQTLTVTEWVALDPASERALLGFLAAQADQIQTILLDTPVEHELGALLMPGVAERAHPDAPPEHDPMATLFWGAMARAVEVPAALVARGYPRMSTSVAVEITRDTAIPDNVGTYTLTLDDGAPHVARGRGEGTPLVAGAIGPISSLLCGGVGLAAAVRAGLVRVEGPVASLDQLFALPVPYPLVVF